MKPRRWTDAPPRGQSPAMNADLHQFVRQALQQGHSRDAIRAA